MEHGEHTTSTIQQGLGSSLGLRDIVAVIIRRRWIILGVSLPIILMALIATLRSTETFTATTRVLIETRQPESPFFRQMSIDYEVFMATAAQVAKSMSVGQIAAEALMDSLPKLREEDETFAEIDNSKKLARVLIQGYDCSPIGSSNILELSFRHPNAHFCRMAIEALTRAYIRYNIESQRNSSAIDYYTEQIRMVEAEIDSLMSERAEIARKAGYRAFKTNMSANINHIKDLESSYFITRSKRDGLARRLRSIKQAIAADPLYMPTVSSTENLALVKAKEGYDEAAAKLATMSLTYKEDSIWMQRQRELVESRRRVFERERGNYLQSLEVKLRELEATEQSYAEAIEQQKSLIKGYPEIQKELESLDLQISAQQDLLEQLQLKRGEVRLKADSDVRISNIVQLDAPTVQKGVQGIKKFLYLGLAFILALITGLMAAIFVENQDHRIYDRRRAEQALEVPVLGAISPTDE